MDLVIQIEEEPFMNHQILEMIFFLLLIVIFPIIKVE